MASATALDPRDALSARARADRGTLICAGVLLSALLVAAALLLGLREHQRQREHALEHAALVAAAVERPLRDRLRQLQDVLAEQAAFAAGARPAAPDPRRLPALRALTVIHDDGRAFSADGRPQTAPSLPPRAATTTTSPLTLLAPMPGERRLRALWDGTPGLRVVAELDPAWSGALLQGYPLPPGGRIVLAHRDRRVYARSHENLRSFGASLADSALFAPERRDRAEGSYVQRGVLDGVDRQLVYRRVAGTPLIVAVSTPLQQIAAPAWMFLALALFVALAFAALWLWLLRVLARSHRAQLRLVEDLSRAGQRLRQAHEIAAIGDWEWDIASGEIVCSETLYRIYGLDPATYRPTADSVFERIHPDDRARLRAAAAAQAEDGRPRRGEFRVVRPDGEVRTVAVHAVRRVDGDGRVSLCGVEQDITALVRTREQLRQTEEQYRYLFERNPVPMWVFDVETLRFLAVNDAALRHYGYDREELLAGTVFDIRPAEDVPAVTAAVRAPGSARGQGQVWTHLRKDGTRLRAAIFTSDIAFEGRPARLVAAQDVTQRELSEERFRLVARATSDAVYDLDLERGVLWWGDSFYAVFGFTPEAMPPTLEAWAGLLHPDDLARVEASLDVALADPAVSEWEVTYRFRCADGRYAEVADRGFFVRDPEGRALRMVGGMLDVSEKRQREADLRLLRRAIEATDNGVVIADARRPDHPMVYVNPAFERITGYAADEILGRNCRALQGDEREQPGVIAIREALRSASEVRTVLRNYRKDGTSFWNEFYMAPVRDEHGALTHFVGIQSDVSERIRSQEQMAHRASHDDLTGLPNRQLLLERLQRAIAEADAAGRGAAVVFIDLDDFKLINDSLGHSAGDAALRIVARRLSALVRAGDTVGRFGGDEFVVVLTGHTDEAGVASAVARLSAALSQPMEINGIQHAMTPSIGYCRHPEHGGDAETLLMRADMAMYQAKRAGRNRAVCYRSEFDGQVSQRLQLVSRLREALARREFALVFQPVFDRHGEPRALECLVRWQHPERGLLPPSEFISVCEESGLMVELGRRILREAARHHTLLTAAGLGHLRLSVNVSAVQFSHDLYSDVAAAVDEFALPAGVLELEITESVVMDQPELAIATMKRIAALGVSLTVDDFGTGYSSLAYLKRLPIDRLKIDRSFVQDLPGDGDAVSICASIVGLAHSLGLAIVGEGVETVEQRQWLQSRGCDELQGYLLGRPAPFDAVLHALQAGKRRIRA